MIRALLIALAALLAIPAAAQDKLPPAPYAYNQLADPRLEAEASALMHTLKISVCKPAASQPA